MGALRISPTQSPGHSFTRATRRKAESDSESHAWSSKPGVGNESRRCPPILSRRIKTETQSPCDLFTRRFFAKPRFQTPSHPEGESAGQRERVAYWIASKLPACHGERYLGLRYEGGSSRSAPRPQTSAGLDSLRANHLLAVMDSGDTGTEEVAKKRFDQLLPCSSSPHTSLYAG